MTDRPAAMSLTCDEVRDLAAGYVLGAQHPAEMTAVHEHLAGCPEAHLEFSELGGVVPYLADWLEPMPPPTALRGRMLAAVAAEAAAQAPAIGTGPAEAFAAARELAPASTGPGPTTASVPAGASVPAAVAPVVSLDAERRRRRSPLVWVASIAAVLLIVGLAAWNVSLRSDLAGAQAYGAAVDRVLALAGTAGGQAAILAPAQPGGPSGIAAVGADGTVRIAMRGLAPTAGTEVYEAWVIGADKTPVAIGSFVPDAGGFGTMAAERAPTGPGVTIALTREPTPGRTTPTPPVLSSGVASGTT